MVFHLRRRFLQTVERQLALFTFRGWGGGGFVLFSFFTSMTSTATARAENTQLSRPFGNSNYVDAKAFFKCLKERNHD